MRSSELRGRPDARPRRHRHAPHKGSRSERRRLTEKLRGSRVSVHAPNPPARPSHHGRDPRAHALAGIETETVRDRVSDPTTGAPRDAWTSQHGGRLFPGSCTAGFEREEDGRNRRSRGSAARRRAVRAVRCANTEPRRGLFHRGEGLSRSRLAAAAVRLRRHLSAVNARATAKRTASQRWLRGLEMGPAPRLVTPSGGRSCP